MYQAAVIRQAVWEALRIIKKVVITLDEPLWFLLINCLVVLVFFFRLEIFFYVFNVVIF